MPGALGARLMVTGVLRFPPTLTCSDAVDCPVTSTGIFRDPERILRAIKRGHRIGFLTVDILPRKTGTAMGGRMGQAIEALKDIGILWWNIRIKRQNL